MSDQNQPLDDAVWKALDEFPQVEPHPHSRAKIWALISRVETPRREFSWRSALRYALPATALAALVFTFALGGIIIMEKQRADREISENIDLYENYEVIRNMGQLASHDDLDGEIFEIIE